jgi:hypothetical protein
MRNAARFTLLIRAARLVTPDGTFVCVIRDVSETGVSIRLFHSLPAAETYQLQMAGGDSYEMRNVWTKEREAGFEFVEQADVAQLINGVGNFPKRGLRLDLSMPVTVSSLTGSCHATVVNFSQQGARLVSDGVFAIDQTIRLKSDAFREIQAKIRWRRDRQIGVVFENTFALHDFARFVARLQDPALLFD